MGTEDHIDTILTELCDADPTLHEVDTKTLRTLVRELIDAKPQVTPREEYVLTLRRELLSHRHFDAKIRTQHSLTWWALHLTPIGVVAMLVLTFLPQGDVLTPQGEPELPRVEDTFEYKVSPTPVYEEGMDAKMSAPASGGDTTMEYEAQNVERYPQSEFLSVFTQEPGMTVLIQEARLVQDGFVVIYARDPRGEERIIGASPLLSRGATSNVYVRVKEALTPGITYRAQLFTDNGDRVFTLPPDVAAFDPQTGAVYETFFGVRG